MDASTASPEPRFSTPFFKTFAGSVAMLNLLVIGATVFSLYESRRQFDKEAVSATRNLTHVLEQYVDGAVDKVDLALQAVVDEAERELAAGSFGKPALDTFVARQLARQTDPEALCLTDAAGNVVYCTGEKTLPKLSLADRHYFQRLRDRTDAGLVFSEPLLGRLTGDWVVVLARRMQRPDRSFAGIVLATVPTERFQRMFSRLEIGKEGSVTLRGDDLKIVARHPLRNEQANIIGNNKVSDEFHDLIREGRTEGTFAVRSAFDGVERLFSFRKVPGHPLTVIVGLAKSDYLAPWRAQVVERAAYAGLFAMITLLWAWVVHRVWVRKAFADRLEQQVRERTAQLRALAIELTMVEERERQAIARDLHDDLGQTLAIAKLKLTAVETPADAGRAVCPHHEGLIQQIKEVECMIDRSNRSVRSLSRQLSPPALHQLGLVPALEWLAEEMHDAYRMVVRVHDDGEAKPLDAASSNMLFRAVRELLINVHKHAGTNEADVSASVHAGHLMIAVTDGGAGFDAKKELTPTASGGFGLFSVSERMNYFGGEMQIDSADGDGTVVVLILPMVKRKEEGRHDPAAAG